MENQNKANASRTQIADISVAGKELSEEHLRIVGGGEGKLIHGTKNCEATCVRTIFTLCVQDCTIEDDTFNIPMPPIRG